MHVSLSGALALLVLGCGAPPPAATPMPPPPAPIAAPVSTLDISALPPGGMAMLGDLHGTQEIPAFVGEVVTALAAREPVVLAIEIPRDLGPSLATYLASDGGPAARQALIAGPWWQDEYQDGRRSVALVALIETTRALRAAGRDVVVVAIDDPIPDSEAREAEMARNVVATREAHPAAAIVVYAGNLHTSRREVGFRPGFAWMAMRVAAAGVAFTNLDPRWAAGTAWICRDAVAANCGVKEVQGRETARGIRLERIKDGAYDGWFGVGPLTASPPATSTSRRSS